jgi:mRNA interferase HigB
MRILAERRLIEFYSNPEHQDAEQALKAWWYEAKKAHWHHPGDIKAQYKNASILKGNRVVFNICGNKYRLIVHFHFNTQRGYIRFIGTHKEYDKINTETV